MTFEDLLHNNEAIKDITDSERINELIKEGHELHKPVMQTLLLLYEHKAHLQHKNQPYRG